MKTLAIALMVIGLVLIDKSTRHERHAWAKAFRADAKMQELGMDECGIHVLGKATGFADKLRGCK